MSFSAKALRTRVALMGKPIARMRGSSMHFMAWISSTSAMTLVVSRGYLA